MPLRRDDAPGTHRSALRRGARLLAVALPALALGSCGGDGGGGGDPVGPGGSVTGPATLAVTPTLSLVAGDPALAPAVTAARVVVTDAGGATRLDTTVTLAGAPTAPFSVVAVLTSARTSGVVQPLGVTVRAELRSAGGATEWSARGTASLTPNASSALSLSFVRGPLPNLDVTGVAIADPTAALDEGASLVLSAAATAGAAGAQVYWRSLDPTVATVPAAPVAVGAGATVTLVAPGVARLVAASGGAADTTSVTVRARIASVVLSQAGLALASLGDTATVTVRALDPRGAEVAGEAFDWSVGDTLVARDLSAGATGRVRAAVNGTTTLVVRARRAPAVGASIPVVVRQVARTVERVERPAAGAPAPDAVAGEFGVRVLDARRNGVAGARVRWDAAGGQVASAEQMTDADGLAVQPWRAGAEARAYTFRAAVDADALAGVETAFTVTVGPAPADPTRTLAELSATELVADGTSTATLRVTVRDAFGNARTAVADRLTVSASGGTITPLVRQTDGTYAATFTASTALGAILLSLDFDDLPGRPRQALGSITLRAGPPAVLAATTPLAQLAEVGTAVAVAPSVRVSDAFGHPLAGVPVTFAASAGTVGAATPATGADGVASAGAWTLPTAAGGATLAASAVGLAAVTFTATATPAPPAQVVVLRGDGQQGTVGAPLATAPAVRVLDRFGNPVAGASVAFAVTLGGGTAAGAAAVTDASGVAAAGGWTLGTAAGEQRLAATVGALPAAVFTATAGAGAPAAIAAVGGDAQTATVATAVAVPPTVRVTDAFGNPVAGVTVTFTFPGVGGLTRAVPLIGTLTGAVQTTGADGRAAVGSWTLTTVVATQGLQATAAGLPPVAFIATSTPAAPASLVVVNLPAAATAGASLGAQLEVRVLDAYGNVTTNASPAVSLALVGGTPLLGTTTATATAGIAAFPDVRVERAGPAYTLVASSPGLPDALRGTFEVLGDVMTRIVVAAPGGGDLAPQAVNVPFAVRLEARDRFDNVATSFASAVSLATTPTGALAAGAATPPFVAGVLDGHQVTVSQGGVFTLRALAADGSALGAGAAVTVNGPPTAVSEAPGAGSAPGDALHTALETPFTLAAPGLLANDALGFPAASVVSFGDILLGGTVTTYPAGTTVAPLPGQVDGSLRVDKDGTIAFTPATNLTGLFSFRYRIQNGSGSSDGIVSIGVGRRPVAMPDVYPVALPGAVRIDTRTATDFRLGANDVGDVLQFGRVSATHGSVTVDPDGHFAFRPEPGFVGAASFTYFASNGFGGSAPATVTIPVADRFVFVSASAPPGGTGHDDAPFNRLTGPGGAASSAAFVPGARLVLAGGTYIGPLTLLPGQELVASAGGALPFTAVTGLPWPADAGPQPNAGPALLTGGVTLAVDNTLRGVTVGDVFGQPALRGSGFGTLTLADVSVQNAVGPALDLANGTLAGGFAHVQALAPSSAEPAVSLTLVSPASPGTSLGAPGDAIEGGPGGALRLTSTTDVVVPAALVAPPGASAAAIVAASGGTIELAGSINPGAPGGGIRVEGSAGATVVFSGPVQRLAAIGPGTAGFYASGNPGALLRFAGGALSIAASGGADGIVHLDGGTLEVLGAGNDVAADGRAVFMLNGDVGVKGVTFRALSGGNTGCAPYALGLLNVGGAGAFTVTGTGSAASGGDLTGRVGCGAAVGLVSVRAPVSLGWVRLRDGASGLVTDAAVTSLRLRQSELLRNDVAVAVLPTGGVSPSDIRLDTVTVQANAGQRGVFVDQRSGSLSLTLERLLAGGAGADSTVNVLVSGSGSVALAVRRSRLVAPAGPAIRYLAREAATGSVVITNDTVTTTSADAAAAAVDVRAGAGEAFTGTVTYDVSDDAITTTGGRPGVMATLYGSSDNAVRLSGYVRRNAITATSQVGVRVANRGQGAHLALLASNVVPTASPVPLWVDQTSEAGGGGAMEATITGHTFANGQIVQQSVRDVGGSPSPSGRVGCLDLSGNVVYGMNIGYDNGTVRAPGFSSPGGSVSAIATAFQAYLRARNTSALLLSGSLTTGVAFSGASCRVP